MTDLPYMIDLMSKNYEALGFLPKPRVEQYANAGQVFMETENGWPCGYLIFGSGWPVLKIYQVCIQYDARRWTHGMNLVKRLIVYADERGFEAITLRCADDLDSNKFWKAAGFTWLTQIEGGAKRGRKLNVWSMVLPKPLQPSLDFARI